MIKVGFHGIKQWYKKNYIKKLNNSIKIIYKFLFYEIILLKYEKLNHQILFKNIWNKQIFGFYGFKQKLFRLCLKKIVVFQNFFKMHFKLKKLF